MAIKREILFQRVRVPIAWLSSSSIACLKVEKRRKALLSLKVLLNNAAIFVVDDLLTENMATVTTQYHKASEHRIAARGGCKKHQAQTIHVAAPPPVTRLVVDTYMHHHRRVSMAQLMENS